MCTGEIQSKEKITGAEVNPDLLSALTGCTELVLCHLFCSKDGFSVQQMSEGRK